MYSYIMLFISTICHVSVEFQMRKKSKFGREPSVRTPQSFCGFDLLSSTLEPLYLFSLEGSCRGVLWLAHYAVSHLPVEYLSPYSTFCVGSEGGKTTTTLNKPLKALVHTPMPWTRYLPRCLDVTLLTDYSFLFVPPSPPPRPSLSLIA